MSAMVVILPSVRLGRAERGRPFGPDRRPSFSGSSDRRPIPITWPDPAFWAFGRLRSEHAVQGLRDEPFRLALLGLGSAHERADGRGRRLADLDDASDIAEDRLFDL